MLLSACATSRVLAASTGGMPPGPPEAGDAALACVTLRVLQHLPGGCPPDPSRTVQGGFVPWGGTDR
jgi:hypothetical protein